jgi:hypothetical protein
MAVLYAQVLVYEATPDDRYLILMSDGISEFIPSQVQLVQAKLLSFQQ